MGGVQNVLPVLLDSIERYSLHVIFLSRTVFFGLYFFASLVDRVKSRKKEYNLPTGNTHNSRKELFYPKSSFRSSFSVLTD